MSRTNHTLALATATATATAIVAATALWPGAVIAHGKKDHPTTTGKVKKEQKPWGIASDARDARRTIEITMHDTMRFAPSAIQVKQGETVRFIVRNQGKMLHEMVIGDKKTLDEHAELMKRYPGMEHDEPYMAHVAAGSQGSLVWTFNRAGDFDFACLIAGHYQAGMVGTIRVAAAR